MIESIAILLVLYAGLFFGLRIGKSVQDEIIPARRYLEIAIDALLLVMLSITLFTYGHTWLAIFVPLALILLRALLPFTYAYAPISGVVLAAATLLAANAQAIVLVLCLVMNFLLGATAKSKKDLFARTIAQPTIALVMLLAIALL